MSEWKKVKIGDFLTESKIIAIESNAAHRITVRLNCKGVEQRSLKAEKEGATKYYTRKSGQFIYGKQNIHKGAFGIIPQELDGFTSSADLPAFDVDLSKCIPEWICICLQKDEYYKTLQKNVKGVGSQRLAVNVFLDSEIPLPPVKKQVEIIKKIKLQLQKTEQLAIEIESQKNYIKQLRQNILQEAIEGKLTADWRKQNPVQKGNPDYDAEALFEKIQNERNSEKKQKELSPITDEEKSFEIPEGWKWVRLGEICKKITDGTHHSPINTPIGDYMYVTAKNIKSTGVELSDITYVTKEIHDEIYSRCNVEYGDILYIKDGATTGIVCINQIKEPFSLLSSVALLKTNFDNKYLKLAMESPSFYEQTRNQMYGVAITRVTLEKMINAIIPFPPDAEQKEIVKQVEKHLQTVSYLDNQITKREELTKQLMQSILKDAFGA